ncbi:MAG: VWA-like domain-containing protein [Desulfovibrio sp.]
MNQDPEALLRLSRARSELVLEMPFFAHLALRLSLHPDASCNTAWTDGKVLAFNSGYVQALPLPKLKGMLCHEVMHLACLHHLRRGKRDAKTWNRACDHAINPLLLDAGVELPSGFLLDPGKIGRSAEEIYSELCDVDRERHELLSGRASQGEGTEDVEGALAGNQEHAEDGADPDRTENTAEKDSEARSDEGGPAPGDSGDAGSESGPDGGADPGMSGEVRDANPSGGSASSIAEDDEQERHWLEAVSRAARKQREAGELPGVLARWLEELVSPPLPWGEILRRFLCRAARNDFTWVRPNRRHLHSGLYLPGLQNEELDEVAVVFDTSGSVEERELQAFAAELSALLEEFDMRLTLITCDAGVTRVERMTRADLPLRIEARGGGGTDFRPPFALLERQGETPSCLMYFTDMNCNRFPEEPVYPVLWVTLNQTAEQPPFGELLRMESCHAHRMVL